MQEALGNGHKCRAGRYPWPTFPGRAEKVRPYQRPVYPGEGAEIKGPVQGPCPQGVGGWVRGALDYLPPRFAKPY